MKNLRISLLLLFFLLPLMGFTQNLVYKPMNPFFGGDTFNYQQLLAEANAQNDFQETQTNNFNQQSDIQNFTDSLNRQLLNSISQDLFQQQFGNQTLSTGTFVFGSLVVDIQPASNGLSVNILDTSTGEQTQIIIPN
ncbi:MAG: curli assembly protein CsgF [Lutibacter sp.]